MKLWIDDCRPAPEGWIWIKSVNVAVEIICANWDMIEVISLDYDAGDFAKYGGDYIEILKLIENIEHVTTLRFTCPIQLHSQNPVGIQNMRAIIQYNGWKEI